MHRFHCERAGARAAAAIALCAIAINAGAQAKPPTTNAPVSATVPATASAPTVSHAPRGERLPDLAFSIVRVQNVAHPVGSSATSIVVDNVVPPIQSSNTRAAANPCSHNFTFPLQLTIKNIGVADFVPLGSAQAVGVNIGTFNSAKDLIKLAPNATQTMVFNVTLPPGNYMLNAMIDLHGQVAESNTTNDKLSWPLQVKCEVRSNMMTAPAPVAKP